MERFYKNFLGFILAILFIFFSPGHAQWSSNPAQNLTVCDTTGEQALPKIAPTSDGGCYISWFDSRAGSYAVYLQRLNAQGEKQWANNGLLISDHPQNSSLVDYDMIADHNDNAIVVFTDIRDGGAITPFAYQISPDGNFLWGADGVDLSTSPSTYQPNPKVAETSEGNFVFVWVYAETPNQIAMQMLSASGVKQWGTDPILLSGGSSENLTYPSVVKSDNGSVIILMSGYTGSFLNPGNYKLYSQKYSSAGAPLWGSSPAVVYGLGNVSGFFVPKIFTDKLNGAFYVWQDDRNSVNTMTSYMQHFTPDGTAQFPTNGSAGSTVDIQNHFDAWMAYQHSTGDSYMFWKETNGLQSLFGIYGQRFSAGGDRQWDSSGKIFKPMDGDASINQICFARGSSVYVYFNVGITGSINNKITGFVTDSTGNIGWTGSMLGISTVLSEKLRLVGTLNSQGISFLAWSDRRNDGGGIYAQNVNPNGTLGIVALPPALTITSPQDSSEVTQFPAQMEFQTENFLIDTLEGDGYLKVSLNGTFYESIYQSQPISIDTLPVGINEVELELVDLQGNSLSPTVKDTLILLYNPVGIADRQGLQPLAFALGQNYPNPFNPETNIRYQLSHASHVMIEIYDITGRMVAELVNRQEAAGHHSVIFNGQDLSSGLYFYRIDTGDFRATRKMILIK